MRLSTPLAALALSLAPAHAAFLGSDTLADLALWSAGALSSPPKAPHVAAGPGGPPEGGWSWTNCGLPTDAVQVESISVSPDPPVPGKNLTVTATGQVLSTVSEGSYADVLVKLGLIKLLQRRFDICEEADNANATLTCPVEPGTYTLEQTVELPREIPRAKFAIDVLGVTAEDEDMLCLKLYIDFLHRKPEGDAH